MPTANKKKRRKNGKYAPLIWIATGAVIAFFIAYSGSLKNLKVFTPHVSQQATKAAGGFSLTNLLHVIPATPVPASVSAVQASSESADSNTIKIFVAQQQSDHEIRLAEQSVHVAKSSSLLKQSLEALIAFHNDNYLNLVPYNTRVRKVWIKNDVAYIDFSEEFNYNSYGITGYQIQIYQVVYTATQFPQVRAVYFYMNGKPMDYLGGDGVIIHNPVYPNSSLPSFKI